MGSLSVALTIECSNTKFLIHSRDGLLKEQNHQLVLIMFDLDVFKGKQLLELDHGLDQYTLCKNT